MKCPTCNWNLREIARYGEKLWVHAFQADVVDGLVIESEEMPPETCPFRGKMLFPSGELFWPPQGYPFRANPVVRSVEDGSVIGRFLTNHGGME